MIVECEKVTITLVKDVYKRSLLFVFSCTVSCKMVSKILTKKKHFYFF